MIAAIQTGRIDAYVATELGWRRRSVGAVDLVPGGGWVHGMEWWFGGAGLTLLAMLVGAAVWLLSRRGVQRDLGVEAWAWVVAYALYLLAVWLPQTSTWRLLLPLFPLAAAVATLPGRWWRAPLVVVAVASQALWLHACWLVVGVDWTVP